MSVAHTGNQNCSPEEADAIAELVERILANGATWSDRNGEKGLITFGDILIITPNNAQVFEIRERLPAARVGTADKFQG